MKLWQSVLGDYGMTEKQWESVETASGGNRTWSYHREPNNGFFLNY